MARAVEPRRPAAMRPAGGNGHLAPPPEFGGRDGPGGGGEPSPVATARVGLWILLVAVTMLFVAFTVSYLSRRSAPDWASVSLPRLLWLNTAVLLASSVVLERTRRAGRRGKAAPVRRDLIVVGGLGVLFLLGQIAAWRELAASGVFMTSNPHSAFFYLLTAVHGLHLLGGLGGLGYALSRTSGKAAADLAGSVPAPGGGAIPAVEGATLYWHFLGALWVYVLLIMSV
ncbi:MAG: cytochrome c oxidase subunit 3 [bacterium]